MRLIAFPLPALHVYFFQGLLFFIYRDGDPAVEVYFVAQALGLQVGKDIGIGSFDDWDIIPSLVQPGLTTMALPHYEMGQWAFNYLLEERTDKVKEAARFTLVSRHSF